MRAARLIAAFAFAMALGCSSRPGELTILELVSVSPAPDSSRVAAGSPIAATFNQPMAASDHWSEWFLVTGGSAPVVGTVLVDRTVVTFKPDLPLENETEYTVRLTREARGRTGVRLDDDYQFKFTTIPVARFAVVLDNRGGWCQSGLWSYALDETSQRLVRRANARAPCGGTAYPDRLKGMVLHPSGRLAFVTFERYGSADGKVFTWAPYLAVYRVDTESGAFRLVGEQQLGSGGAVAAVNPALDYLYVAGTTRNGGGTQPALFVYGLEVETGALTPATGSPFIQEGLTGGLRFHPNGRFGYGSATLGVAAFAVDSGSGALATVAGSPFGKAGQSPIAVDPSGRFLFAAGQDQLQVFAVEAITGALSTAGGPISIPAPISALQFTADGGSAFALAGTSLLAWRFDSVSGGLSQLPGSPLSLPGTARSLAVHPEGHLVLVWFEESSLLVPLVVGAGGIASASSGSYDAGANVLGVDLEPSGVRAVIRTTSELSLWTIEVSTGAMARASGLPLPGGDAVAGPLALQFVRGKHPVHCAPTHAYVLNRANSSVAAFTIDTGTGALEASGSPFQLGAGVDASALVVDLLGSRLFVLEPSSGRVAMLAIDPATGALSALGISPVAPDTGLQSMAIDPSGGFVYLVRSSPPVGEGRLAVYSVDLVSGAMARLGSMSSGGAVPAQLAIDPSGELAYVPDSASCQVWELGIYRFGSSQQLSERGAPVAVSPCAGTGGRLVLDLEGRLIATDTGNDLHIFMGPTSLTPAAQVSIPTGVDAAAIDPWGAFAWATSSASGSARVYPFAVDRSGKLSSLDSVGAGTTLHFLSVDPSGSFLFALDGSSAKIHGFSLDRTTGALVPISGSPFLSGGVNPAAMVVANGCR